MILNLSMKMVLCNFAKTLQKFEKLLKMNKNIIHATIKNVFIYSKYYLYNLFVVLITDLVVFKFE